ICQPHRCPDAAARQLCVEKAVPAEAIASAAAMILWAGMPHSDSPYSGVNWSYSSSNAFSKDSKVRGQSGREASRNVSQFTQRLTDSRLYFLCSMRYRAKHSISAASVPEFAGSHMSALADVLDSLGSTTMSFAPLDLPSMIRCACGLK